jgi:hypothetical protein
MKPYPSGFLNCRIAETQEDGSVVWRPYDTRGQTVEPSGDIMVFDFSTGSYEKARNLAHAQELFEKHIARITPDPNTEGLERKAESVKARRKALQEKFQITTAHVFVMR